jgi:nucleotide-binding universal stress UspA family protein
MACRLLVCREGGEKTNSSSSPARGEGLPFRHILVPLDGSALAECALPFAGAIARAFSGRIMLLRVIEHPRGRRPGRQMDPVECQIMRAEAHSHLAQFESELKASGIASGLELVQGRAAEQIIQFAKEHEIDLIVLSSHGEGGLSGWVLSSTAQKVVARAHTSILIVPAYAHQGTCIGELRFDKILVPLDCSPRAESILPLATALAHAYESKLILAHIVPEPELPRRMPPSPEDVALVAQLTERNRCEAEHYLNEIQRQLSTQGVGSEVRIVVSPRRARSIRALAEQENVNLVLVSAHGKTGDASERYGGIAARLIQESGRPVLVLQDLAGGIHEATAAAEAARSHPGH